MGCSILDGYDPQGFYCEMLGSPASAGIRERLSGLSIEALEGPRRRRQCRAL